MFLLVDDDPNDVMLLRRAFGKARILNPLQVVSSGDEAMAYLSGTGQYGNRSEFPFPTLVLLDLKMPRMDGFELLRWIRQQPQTRTLRVVVLTNSNSPVDIELAYKEGANSFLVKPSDFERFVEVSQALNGYWMWLDKGPPITDGPLLSIARAASVAPPTNAASI